MNSAVIKPQAMNAPMFGMTIALSARPNFWIFSFISKNLFIMKDVVYKDMNSSGYPAVFWKNTGRTDPWARVCIPGFVISTKKNNFVISH